MVKLADETTEYDWLHLAVERIWKDNYIQREFWKNHGWLNFYLRYPVPLSIDFELGTIPEVNIVHMAMARYHRDTNQIVITTSFNHDYKWIIK